VHLRDTQTLGDLTLRQLEAEPQHDRSAAARIQAVEPRAQIETPLDLLERRVRGGRIRGPLLVQLDGSGGHPGAQRLEHHVGLEA